MKKHPLKSLLKNITKSENKALGRSNPFHLGYTVAEQARSILGCSIEEHPLFYGDLLAIERANNCSNLAQLINIFNQQLSNPQ